MENFKKCKLEFVDIELSGLVSALNISFDKQQDSFIYICRDVYKIWSYCNHKYWQSKNNNYYNSYQLLAVFGFDKPSVSKYKNCYERFIVDNGTTFALAIPFQNFSPSKLYELLPLSQDTVFDLIGKKLVTPTMTVKQIREFVKTFINGSDKKEKVVEDNAVTEEDIDSIPMAYDPTKHYDFDYFKNLSKQQLINNIWELQKEYERLKTQAKTTKPKSLKQMLVG